MATPGRRALVNVTGAAITFTNEACTGNAGRTIYTITNAAKSVWDPQLAVTVQTSPDGSTWTTQLATAYMLNRLTGQVTFGVARASGTQVRVSGSYLPLSLAAGCKAFSYALGLGVLVDTDFDGANTSGGFNTKQRGQYDASGTLSRWDQRDAYYSNALLNSSLLVIEHWTDRTTSYDLRAWAFVTKDGFSGSSDALVEESVDWIGIPDADGRVISG